MVDIPPYVFSEGRNPFELEGLRRGVTYQVIYDVTSLDAPGKLDWMRALYRGR